jgi:hypothetical protein
MKYEIVEFRNNKFGIRRRTFLENLFNYGGDFLDFKGNVIRYYFWTSKSNFFNDCQTSDIDVLFEFYSKFKNDYVLNTFKNGILNR